MRATSLTRWLKLASAALVVATSVSGAGILAQKTAPAAPSRPEPQAGAARAGDLVTFQTKPGKLAVTVIERGSLEAGRVAEVFCGVAGPRSVRMLKPDGSKVKKGDVVCELESDWFNQELPRQQVKEEAAKTSWDNARVARELAEQAVTAYVEGDLKQARMALAAAIAESESAINNSQARRLRAEAALKRLSELVSGKATGATSADIVAELDVKDRLEECEQTVMRERHALDLARTKLDALEKLTMPKTIGELKAAIEQKRPAELAARSNWQLEDKKTQELRRQIANCVLTAPDDGVVLLAYNPQHAADGPPQIGVGAYVQKNQKILSVLNDSIALRVNAKIAEQRINKVKHGMKARIRVDAFADRVFNGWVSEVAPLPDPNFRRGGAMYSTKVDIDSVISGLRPGMTAEVEIMITERDNVLSVPMQAVVRYGNQDYLAVRKPGGAIEWREVTRGIENDKFVEIVRGIESGETVVLNAQSLDHPK